MGILHPPGWLLRIDTEIGRKVVKWHIKNPPPVPEMEEILQVGDLESKLPQDSMSVVEP